MKGEGEKEGTPGPEIGEKMEEQIRERLRHGGMDGRIVKPGDFNHYYFFPDEAKDVCLQLEKLSIRVSSR